MRQREEGCCYAYSKSDGGSSFTLPRSEFARLRTEWMAGKAFWEGKGFYGSTLVIKLGDIVAIADTAPEDMALARTDKAADEKEDSIA